MTRSDVVGTIIGVAALAVCAAHTPAYGLVNNYHPKIVKCDPKPTKPATGPVYNGPTYNGPTYQAPQAPVYNAPTYAAPVYEAPTYNPPTYTAPSEGEGSTGNSGSQSQSLEYQEKRELPYPAPLPEVVQPSFSDDPRDDTDFRVFSVAEIVKELGPGLDREECVRLSSTKAKVADSLIRSRFKKTNFVKFEAPPAGARFLGWAPVYTDSNQVTSMNLVGSAGVFACENGATHAVLVKEGYRRAGTFEGWHIGFGSSAMGINDGNSSGWGGSASVGPGYTSAESVRVDRPFAVFKLYTAE